MILITLFFGYFYLNQALEATLTFESTARLFFDGDLETNYIDYTYNPTRPCMNFRKVRSTSRISSINTNGSCIRIFKYVSCLGESLAIYPGSPYKDSSAIFTNFASIGPCLRNEFENAYIDSSGAEATALKESAFGSIPDLLEFGGLKYRRNSTKITCGITGFSKSYNGRLEFLTGKINRLSILSEEDVQQTLSFELHNYYNSLEKTDDDVMGWALPFEFKGLPVSYNLFPQLPNSKIQWKEIITGVLENHENVLVQINFIYPGTFSTRPTSFIYRFYNQGLVSYGIVRNFKLVDKIDEIADLQYKEYVLTKPRAELLVKSNLTGASTERYNFTRSNCKNRYVSSDDETISIRTHGTCIRLFEDSHCKGWSLAIYPGSSNPGDVNLRFDSHIPEQSPQLKAVYSKLNWVFSLGPCFPQEFADAEVITTGDSKLFKKGISSVPDVVDTKGDANPADTTFLNCPMEEVFLGFDNRVEYLKVSVNRNVSFTDTSQPIVSNKVQQFYETRQKKEGDLLTFIFPLNDKSAEEFFNVIPVSFSAKQKWQEVLGRVRMLRLDNDSDSIVFLLTFSYESPISTRPVRILYSIFYRSAMHEYGLIKN